MANPVALNNKTHRDLRVITSRGAGFGENIHIVPVIADELGNLVLDYPVCLIKDPETGRFKMSALLGFDPGENLYLEGDRWNALYVPLHVQRQPFMVGYSAPGGAGGGQGNPVITIDMDSRRVQKSEGEALFNEDGSNTPFLDHMNTLLAGLMDGMKSTEYFVETLANHDLIEPAQFNIEFADGEKKSYEGLYTVNDEKLAELKGDVLEDLHSRGYLRATALMMASLGHVSRLISRKNAQRSAQA